MEPRYRSSKIKQKHIYSAFGRIYVTGGQWCGRKLPVLNNPNLRPTTSRARETLFNWLNPIIKGAHCLDCFAGSGILSFEALSRDAASVVLLERNRATSIQLSKNISMLKTTQKAKVINTDSLRWIARPGFAFDIVFIDPPFYHDIVNTTVIFLEKYKRLANIAWIYIETETKGSFLNMPNNWQLYRNTVYGQVEYKLYIRHIISKI